MRTKTALGLALSAALLPLIVLLAIRPSNNRDWSPDQAVLPVAEIDGERVNIRNIRNFTYRSTTDYDIAYYDKTVNLHELDSLWYIVEPFSEWEGAAHTFLSFGFGDDYLGISVEVRKEKGETFSSVKGLLKQYELMYVVGDERDLVKLRSNYRKDQVYVYPVKARPDQIRKVFLSMIGRINELNEKPEFYNTLTNTCTTNIVAHANEIVPGKIPFSFEVLAPGYSDKFAYDLGLIDTDLPFDQARAKYNINERAMTYADAPDFSRRIRE